ncbi:MAG TPA: MFS transporter [Planctomycetota bacterium]|nr:MFS transporter [Planctomycetota bacterium]
MRSAHGLRRVVHVLATNRDVRTIWLVQVLSETGDWLTRVAVVSHVTNLAGGSAIVVAAIQALMIVPFFVVSPVAGALADRLPRRGVMIATDAAAALLVLAYVPLLAAPLTTFTLVLLGAVVFLHLGLAAAFEAARGALLAAVASPEDLPAVNALAQTTWSICLALGSALGGWLVATHGTTPTILVDSLTFAAGAALLLRLRGGRVAATAAAGETGGGLGDALRYLRAHPTTAALVLPKLALGFVGMNDLAFALLGPEELAIPSETTFSRYYVSVGIGTAVGPLVAMSLARARPRAMRIAIAVAFLLEAAIFSGTIGARTLPATVAFAGAATAGGATIWVFSTALLQRAAPDRLAGRILALDLGLYTLSVAVSSLVGGALHDVAGLGVRQLFAVTTGVYATGGLVWLAAMAALRRRAWDGDGGRPR